METSYLGGIAVEIRSAIAAATGSAPIADLLMTIIGIALILGVITLAALVFTYGERKVAGFVQVRLGPNRVGGRYGLLQPVADMLKLLSKEDIRPNGRDKVLWALAPMLLFIPAALAYAFFPFDLGVVLADVHVGVFLLFAITGQAVLAFLMAGYASNSKYSLIGAFRSVSQMMSYEAPLLFSLLGILMITGSMRLEDIVEAQRSMWFIVLQPLAFIVFIISAVAETNRTPFDLVEGESEIIAGPYTEYSGMRWALFFLAEYANLLTAAMLVTTFFLGGYLGPAFLPGFVWFFLKAFLMVFVIMWFRWTFPRTRVDQILAFGWKGLLPLSILNVFATGVVMYALGLV